MIWNLYILKKMWEMRNANILNQKHCRQGNHSLISLFKMMNASFCGYVWHLVIYSTDILHMLTYVYMASIGKFDFLRVWYLFCWVFPINWSISFPTFLFLKFQHHHLFLGDNLWASWFLFILPIHFKFMLCILMNLRICSFLLIDFFFLLFMHSAVGASFLYCHVGASTFQCIWTLQE